MSILKGAKQDKRKTPLTEATPDTAVEGTPNDRGIPKNMNNATAQLNLSSVNEELAWKRTRKRKKRSLMTPWKEKWIAS